jgi:hypothetical protein
VVGHGRVFALGLMVLVRELVRERVLELMLELTVKLV